MSVERNRSVAASVVEAFASGNSHQWLDVCAPTFVHHIQHDGFPSGVRGAVELTERLLLKMTDVAVDTELVVAEHDHVAQRINVTATLKDSKQPVKWTQNQVFEFDHDGRVTQ
jgi:predicted ester cyclase